MSTESVISIASVIITAILTYVIASNNISSEFSKIQTQSNLVRKQQDRVYLINLKIEESRNIIYSLESLLNIQLLINYVYHNQFNDEYERLNIEISKALSNLTVTINYFPELKERFVKVKSNYFKITNDIFMKQHMEEKLPIKALQNESLDLVFEISEIQKSVGNKVEELIIELEENYK